MARKTPEQRIASLEAQLAKAKEQQRKARTRELIQLGAMLEQLGPKVRELTDAERKLFIVRTLQAFDALVGRPKQDQRSEHQGEANAQP